MTTEEGIVNTEVLLDEHDEKVEDPPRDASPAEDQDHEEYARWSRAVRWSAAVAVVALLVLGWAIASVDRDAAGGPAADVAGPHPGQIET
jgi:hypothetical protein